MKGGKWAREILQLQQEDGLWGYFHTLSEPSKAPITTEQALRRLHALGYTIEDEPIARAVEYMHDCLIGKREMPDRREKVHDWDIFTELMLATWIRRFTDRDEAANRAAEKWAAAISAGFASGAYCQADYEKAYAEMFGMKPRGGRLVDFYSFYQVSLMTNMLDAPVEKLFFDRLLQQPQGVYYMYETQLCKVPEIFASKKASRYLAVMEMLAGYRSEYCRQSLQFVAQWLRAQEKDGCWDMGKEAKDGIYLPLSDSWRRSEDRIADCTKRVKSLLGRLEANE